MINNCDIHSLLLIFENMNFVTGYPVMAESKVTSAIKP